MKWNRTIFLFQLVSQHMMSKVVWIVMNLDTLQDALLQQQKDCLISFQDRDSESFGIHKIYNQQIKISRMKKCDSKMSELTYPKFL